MSSTWDIETDIVIIGSGGGGLTAALKASDLGADVIILEKSTSYGGTTAYSGGVVWAPNNRHMKEVGIPDSREDAVKYLKALCDEKRYIKHINAYIDYAPKVVDYIEENTPITFRALGEYPDYYPEIPGGKPGGRTIEAQPLNGKLLGEDLKRLRKPPRLVLLFGRASLTIPEIRSLALNRYGVAFKRILGYYLRIHDRIRYDRDTRLTMGCALIAGLKIALNKRKVPIYLNTAAKKLIVEEKRVVGVTAYKDGKKLNIKVRRGVIIAAGGFSKDTALISRILKVDTRPEWSAAVESDGGEFVRMTEEIGALIEHDAGAWWMPIAMVPGDDYPRLIVVERHMPGSIIVNARGERFINEAAPFMDVGKAMIRCFKELRDNRIYLIIDSKHRSRYMCGPLFPGKFYPEFLWKRRYKDWIIKAGDIRELAGKIGVDEDNLVETIERFNKYAEEGVDRDFNRGESLYDRYYSDDKVRPNPNLAPLKNPPYYAVRLYLGNLGTKGGVATDEWARVQYKGGGTIHGLYAVGNSTLAPFGDVYPGSGASVGPSMIFGYIAAIDLMK